MTTDNGKLSFKEKLGFGMGDAASNFFFQVFNLFLLYYYTDVFGINPAAVATMMIVTKIVDMITDPVMGIIADRTQSRWGKYRPYLLWGAIPYGLCGYLMFANPELSEHGKLIYAYITYTLMMMAYTVINVPYSALGGVISPSSLERTKVASYRFICAFLAGWLIATFVTPLKSILGGDDEALGFQLTMALFAFFSIGLFWLTFASTKERVKPPVVKYDLKKDFAALWQNLAWKAMFLTAIFTLMNLIVRNSSILYYFKYYVQDNGDKLFWIFDKTAIFMSTSLLTMVIGIILTKPLVERFDKKWLLITLSAANALLLAAFFFIPPEQYATMLFVNCLAAFIAGPTAPIVWAMYADTADYGEWKTGRRNTGMVFSALQFAQKFGLAVGAGLAGYILAMFGFVANEVQSDTSILGIRLMFSIFPAVLALLGVAALFLYNITPAHIKQMEKELSEGREQ